MKNITFKNGTHEINYLIEMNLIPENLRENKEIQAAIYLVALIESYSAGAAKYIFRFVKKYLPTGFFDSHDQDIVAKSLALRFFDASYLAVGEEWDSYFFEAVSLDFFAILDRNKMDFNNYLLHEFKKMDMIH